MRCRLSLSFVVIVLAVGFEAQGAEGASWVVRAFPHQTISVLDGVSCSSIGACATVGSYYPTGETAVGTERGLAARSSGTPWVVRTPKPAGMKFGAFGAVSCVSARACTAVGYYGTRFPSISYSKRHLANIARAGGVGSPVQRSMAAQWNGRRWIFQRAPTPVGAQDAGLLGVSCASATACMAVGNYFDLGVQTPYAERWNGRRWLIESVPMPVGASAALFGGVSCPSANRCIAVGSYVAANSMMLFAERWNGTQWSLQRIPQPAGPGGFLVGVSCSSVTACTAVGGYTGPHFSRTFPGDVTLAERWNGQRWSIQPTPNPAGIQDSRLLSVSCASPTSCTTVGWHATGRDDAHLYTLAEIWNGQRWLVQRTPNPGAHGSALQQVSCTAAKACTAVGYYNTGGYTNGVKDSAGLVERSP
jgi:hypothetical protein